MSAPTPKPDSPFAARASTRAPFPAPSSPPAPPPAVIVEPKGGLPWRPLLALVVLGGGGVALWLSLSTRSKPAPVIAGQASAPAPAPLIVVPTPLPSAPVSPAPKAKTAAQVQELRATFEKLVALATSLDLDPRERAAFADSTLAATQAQNRFAAGDLEASALRWREAAHNLGQIVNARLVVAYEAEAGALRGLNLAEYSGPAVKALGDALAAAESAGAGGDWAAASLERQEARGLIARAQADVAAQMGEAAKNAAARGDMDLATYFYERALRLDANQPAARAHLYLHKFKAGELARTSTGMELAYIPPGAFTQGSQSREPGRSADETPHTVRLTRGFFMGTKEVTQRDWDAVFGEGAASRALLASRTVSEARSRDGWIGPDLPMHSVRWADAAEFCRRLSTLEKRVFRLPTEAEWEYACRGGVATAFNTGSDGLSARDANIDDGSTEARYALAVASDAARANRLGLRDMHGNVWEWCSDWSAPYPAGPGPFTDPAGPSDADAGRLDVAMKVVRGGGWNASASEARSANRSESSPVVGLGYIGLRVVQEPVLAGP
jgi:formylglycine-generating enzyme